MVPALSLPKQVSPIRPGTLVLQPVSRYNQIMQHTFEEVRQIACELPEDQRVLLANSLWESVGSDTVDPAAIEAAWDGEIKRRLDEIDSGAVELVPLEDVLARMDARLLARQHG
jgi:putative addiction module component (TIGR02574 family)